MVIVRERAVKDAVRKRAEADKKADNSLGLLEDNDDDDGAEGGEREGSHQMLVPMDAQETPVVIHYQ